MSAVGVADHSYLGREFLTWLWFKCEVEGGEFDIPSGRIDLIVEDNLVLVGHDDDTAVSQVKGGCPTLRPESASALAAGMTVRRARLHCARDEREWSFTIDAETLDLKSLKVPAVEAEDPLEQMTERLEAAEEMRDALEELFSEFLGIRLRPVWTRVEAERMREWVRMKLSRAEEGQNNIQPPSVFKAKAVLEEAARHAASFEAEVSEEDSSSPLVDEASDVDEELSAELDSEDLEEDDED